MPYGSNTNYSSSVGSEIVSVNGFPGGSQNSTQILTADVLTYSNHWTRSGGKNSLFRTSRKERNPAFGHWEVRYVDLPNGPRLRYKVYNHKLKRWIWARRLVKVPKKVWVSNFPKGKKKGLSLPPTNLSYHSASITGARSSKTVSATHSGYPTYYRSITGELWYPRPSLVWAHGMYDYSNYIAENLYPAIQFSSEIVALESKALSKLYEKVKNQSVNIGQIIAERRQTLSTIKDVLSKIVGALLAAKRGNLKKAASIIFPQDSKQLANDHLVLMYGVMPLIGDLQGVVKAVTRPEKPYRFTESAIKRTVIKDMPVDHSTRDGVCCKTKVYREVEIIVKYQATMEIEFPSSRPLSELGLQNLASLGWELTPWSFVIDWLIPIGDYLNSFDAFSGLKVVSVHKSSLVKEQNFIVREIGGVDSNGYKWGSSTDSLTCKRVSCMRNVLADIPDPPLPEIKDPFSIIHCANAIALIRQLFK